MGDNPRVLSKDEVDPLGLYIAEGVDGALILGKAAGNLSGTQLLSVPVPDLYFRGGLVPYSLTEQQRIPYGVTLLGVNYTDFLLNDVWLDNRHIPDPTNSNVDVDPNDALKDGVIGFTDGGVVLPDRLTPTTFKLFLGEIDYVTDPSRDMIGMMHMIRNTPENKPIQVLNIGYYGAQLLLTTTEFNNSVGVLSNVQIDSTDPRVSYFIQETGGYPAGVDHEQYEEDVAELISLYQNGGNSLSHQDLFRWAREVWGMDLSDEDDPMAAIILGAAEGTTRVAPTSSLAAMLTTMETLGAGKRFELGVTATSGIQYTLRETMQMDPLEEDLVAGTVSLVTGAAQLGLASQLPGAELQPLTVGAVGLEQVMGFTNAKIADGDPALMSALILTSSRLGGCIAEPRALAGLTYANDLNYKPKDDGNGGFEYTPNPTIQGLTFGVIGASNVADLSSAKASGHYLRIYKTTEDPRYLAPIIQLGLTSTIEMGAYGYFMSNNPLPKEYRDEYEAMLYTYDIDTDDMKGSSAQGTMLAGAGISLGSTALGVGWGYLAQMRIEKREKKIALMETAPAVLAAQTYYDTLVADGAAPEQIQFAQDQLVIANVEDSQNPDKTPEQEFIDAVAELDRLTAEASSPERIALAEARVEYAREQRFFEVRSPNPWTETFDSLQLTGGPAMNGVGVGIGVTGRLPDFSRRRN